MLFVIVSFVISYLISYLLCQILNPFSFSIITKFLTNVSLPIFYKEVKMKMRKMWKEIVWTKDSKYLMLIEVERRGSVV